MLSEKTSTGLAENPRSHPKLRWGVCAGFGPWALDLPIDEFLIGTYAVKYPIIRGRSDLRIATFHPVEVFVEWVLELHFQCGAAAARRLG